MSRGLFGFGFLQVSLDRLVCCLAQLNAGYTRKRKKRKELQTGLYNSPVRTAREKVLSAHWNILLLCQVLSLKLNATKRVTNLRSAKPKNTKTQLKRKPQTYKWTCKATDGTNEKPQVRLHKNGGNKTAHWRNDRWFVLLAFASQWSGVEIGWPGVTKGWRNSFGRSPFWQHCSTWVKNFSNSWECFPAGLFSHNPISHRPANKRFSNSSGWSKGVSCCNPSKSSASRHWWREGPSEILELDGTLSTQLYVGAEESWE